MPPLGQPQQFTKHAKKIKEDIIMTVTIPWIVVTTVGGYIAKKIVDSTKED